MKEIQDINDAIKRVETLFGGTTNSRLQKAVDIANYALIALFLTDTKRVNAALEEVSKQIWIRYNLPQLKQSPNRFSRAIIKYGVDEFGFAAQENIVFTGALGGREFVSYVRSGVLWKDSFAPSHGEFSHSLQWFAAGQALNLRTSTAALYKKAGSVYSNSDKMKTRGETDAITEARQPLWAWLVDCFDPGNLTIADDDINHVFSKKFRQPNQITNLALQKTDWFINLYMDHRKQWLAKIAEAGKQMRVAAGETNEPESRLLGIVKYQTKTYPRNPQWSSDETAPADHRSKNVFRKTSSTETTKEQTEKTYHGIKGEVSMRPITGKSLVT
jgi:hypothetical protein